jgi:hypothetical protein
MTDAADRLTPAGPQDVASALAFALQYRGRKRARDSRDIMAEVVAERLVAHLERSGFVIMRKLPALGAAPLRAGLRGR